MQEEQCLLDSNSSCTEQEMEQGKIVQGHRSSRRTKLVQRKTWNMEVKKKGREENTEKNPK